MDDAPTKPSGFLLEEVQTTRNKNNSEGGCVKTAVKESEVQLDPLPQWARKTTKKVLIEEVSCEPMDDVD